MHPRCQENSTQGEPWVCARRRRAGVEETSLGTGTGHAGLKRGGVDKDTAQKILKVWEETGAKSPDQLRKLLVGRSLKAAGLVGFQTLLDAGTAPDYLAGAFLKAQKS